MKSRYLRIAFAVFLLAVAGPVLAQEDEPAGETEPAGGKIFAEIGTWVSQPAGLDLEPALVFDNDNPFSNTILDYPVGTEQGGYYRAGYEFGGNIGGLILTWASHAGQYAVSDLRPEDFVFGELLVDPLFAGYANDGLADGVEGSARTALRDLRLDFYRQAFRSRRIEGRWFVGYRRVTFKRTQDVNYYAIVPDLPSVTFPPSPATPRPELFPQPDAASQLSLFEGRGFEGGLEVSMPLIGEKVFLESGLSVAAIRGKTDIEYRSTTHAYTLGGLVVLEQDYGTVFSDPGLFGSLQQVTVVQGLEDDSRSTSATVIGASLGVRWRILQWLEAFGGFRNVRYSDVITDLRTGPPFFGANANLASVQEDKRSVTFEGFYGGVAVRF